MDELNRQLLKNAIGQLPVHKAADYIWEEVRWGLDKPLSAELPLHQAPENSWSLLMNAARGESGNRYFLSFVSFFLSILLVSIPLAPLVDKTFSPMSEVASFHAENTYDQTVTALQPLPAISNSPGATAYSGYLTAHPVTKGVPGVKQENTGNQAPVDGELLQNEFPGLYVPAFIENPLFVATDPEAPGFRKPDRKTDGCSPFHQPQASLFMLATYEPMFFDSPGLGSPVHGYALNAGFEYNRLRLSLGAGYLQLGSNSKVNYEYRSNELIYSYDYVDSVYIDPITHQTYYFTVKVDVYDSVDHTATEDVHDRFSFLKIPLILSYELTGFRNFSLHLQAGAAYHILQNDKRSFKPFNEASSRLVSTAIEAKKINAGFWSTGGGITLGYKAGKVFELQVTPRINYSFISISGLEPKPEISYSILFGILYKINAGQ